MKKKWLSDSGEAEHELKGFSAVVETKEIGHVAKEDTLLLQFLLFRACEGSTQQITGLLGRPCLISWGSLGRDQPCFGSELHSVRMCHQLHRR